MEAFGKYVPLTVVQGLLGGTILPQLGMEERSLAVGFMDVEDFTALCESHHGAGSSAHHQNPPHPICDHGAVSPPK